MKQPFNEEEWFRGVVRDSIPGSLSQGTEALLDRYADSKQIYLGENLGKTVRLCAGDEFMDVWPFHKSDNGVYCAIKTVDNNRLFFVIRGTVLSSCSYDELTQDEIDFAHFFVSSLTEDYREDLIERGGNSFIGSKDAICEGGNLVVQVMVPVELEEYCIEKGIFKKGETFSRSVADADDNVTEFLVSKRVICIEDAITAVEIAA